MKRKRSLSLQRSIREYAKGMRHLSGRLDSSLHVPFSPQVLPEHLQFPVLLLFFSAKDLLEPERPKLLAFRGDVGEIGRESKDSCSFFSIIVALEAGWSKISIRVGLLCLPLRMGLL